MNKAQSLKLIDALNTYFGTLVVEGQPIPKPIENVRNALLEVRGQVDASKDSPTGEELKKIWEQKQRT
jgi:hypothetical protein